MSEHGTPLHITHILLFRIGFVLLSRGHYVFGQWLVSICTSWESKQLWTEEEFRNGRTIMTSCRGDSP